MLYFPTIMSVLGVLTVTIPALLTVPFATVAEIKIMASMKRRLGSNEVSSPTKVTEAGFRWRDTT